MLLEEFEIVLPVSEKHLIPIIIFDFFFFTIIIYRLSYKNVSLNACSDFDAFEKLASKIIRQVAKNPISKLKPEFFLIFLEVEHTRFTNNLVLVVVNISISIGIGIGIGGASLTDTGNLLSVGATWARVWGR